MSKYVIVGEGGYEKGEDTKGDNVEKKRKRTKQKGKKKGKTSTTKWIGVHERK